LTSYLGCAEDAFSGCCSHCRLKVVAFDLNVVLLSLGYPPYVFGGVETYVSLLGRQLAQRGVQTTVVSGWPRRQVSNEKHGENLRIVRLPLLDFPIRSIWFQILNSRSIIRIIEEADLVHSNSPQTSLINSKLQKAKPLIITMHGSLEALSAYLKGSSYPPISVGDFLYLAEYPLIRRFYFEDLRNSDLLIHVAKHVRAEALKYAPKWTADIRAKSEIIPAGIDLGQFGLKPTSFSKAKGLDIAFVGRLFYPKGITFSLEALDLLVNEFGCSSITLHIFGKGPLENWISHFVGKRKLQRNVIAYGHLKRDALLEKLRCMRAVVLPSIYEGCPYVLLEANALNIPVVSFSFPWSKEFIVEGCNGFLSTPFDIRGLAENILRAVDLKSSKIREYVADYDIGLAVDKMIRAYERVVDFC
jgi:glycosyltransferase involved in cell wall biosynthesis